jgi:conjugative relaxase-like TrwC/TraI family protein
VLSATKLGVGQERYYLEFVTSGVEDYYLGVGEAPGEWVGTASARLGLDGTVDAEDLGRVLDRRDPRSGVRLTQARRHGLPGFELTFSPPKSVSVLWGLGSADTARSVRVAHDAAVTATLTWMEREACWSRRGTDGVEHIAGGGFVAAAFVHRTSRDLDPQLHTHVLVANMTRCNDGVWRTLDGHALLWQAKTAGYLYKAQLRWELTRRLGVAWGPVDKGAAEIIGVPDRLIDLFSTRRNEIEEELASRGLHSPQAARAAALSTRRPKDHTADGETLRGIWRDRAAEARIDARTIEHAVLDAGRTQRVETDGDLAAAALLGPAGLTERRTTFDRRAVLRAWCDQLRQGAPINTIEALTRRTVAEREVVPLQSGSPFGKYTTLELLALERRLLDAASSGVDTDSAVVDEAALRGALDARPSLSGEQVESVARLVTSGNAVDALVAAAGTGKTFCLDAAADAWRRAGYRVVGAALAATAAAQLQAQTAIPSDTIALRALQLDEGNLQLDARTVIVVDEAAMVGTRQLAPLLDHAQRARAKVVLVGDPGQLDAIGAGGFLAGLARRHGAVRLRENRRQIEQWERDALDELRAGRAERALASYATHDRVATAPTAIDVRNRMAADWYAAHLAGERVVMLAERRYDVDDLNRRARLHLTAAGVLSGPAIVGVGNEFRCGDRILCLRNNRRLGVTNGMLATVADIDERARALTALREDGTMVALPARYLDAGNVAHGYALTVHKAQGATVDACLVLASDTLDRNAGYTALSRGRTTNRLYLVERHTDEPDAHRHVPNIETPAERVTAALRVSKADRLAADHIIEVDGLRQRLRDLYREREPHAAVVAAAPPDRSDELTALRQQRERAAAELDRARAHLDKLLHLRPGLRYRSERLAARVAAERDHHHATAALDRLRAAIETAQHGQRERDRYLRHNTTAFREVERIDGHARPLGAQIVDRLTRTPPAYLAHLGPVPPDGPLRKHWQHAAVLIECYRAAHNITDPIREFGNREIAPGGVFETDVVRINSAVSSLHVERSRLEAPVVERGRHLSLEL